MSEFSKRGMLLFEDGGRDLKSLSFSLYFYIISVFFRSVVLKFK